jgi:hypothetical protein
MAAIFFLPALRKRKPFLPLGAMVGTISLVSRFTGRARCTLRRAGIDFRSDFECKGARADGDWLSLIH